MTKLTEFEQEALGVIGASYQPVGEPKPDVQPHEVVWIHSRGQYRRGVVSVVTVTRCVVTYTTEGAVNDAHKTCDLIASGKSYYAHLDETNPQVWARQSAEWQQARREDLSEAKLGHWTRFVTFTNKSVKRTEVRA